jgi:hypothetical protein
MLHLALRVGLSFKSTDTSLRNWDFQLLWMSQRDHSAGPSTRSSLTANACLALKVFGYLISDPIFLPLGKRPPM